MSKHSREWDVIVVGGGHAGCEAADAAARLGARTLLLTKRVDRIAEMSCNPAVGGLGKGQLVREVDALGGLIGRVSDAAGIQFRVLNRSRGPAVRALRAQEDKAEYREKMSEALRSREGLEILEAEALEILVGKGGVRGLQTTLGELKAGVVVLTTGTFLRGLIHIGEEQIRAGRVGEEASYALPCSLAKLGLKTTRLKTGTPPRLTRRSIDFGAFAAQEGDEDPEPFSFLTDRIRVDQVPCYIGATNGKTHELVRANLDKSALYGGRIEGRGPRYCPSIEDKVVKFPEKTCHQVFLEPEYRDGESIYLNGVSTSLPEAIQVRVIRSIRGLEEAEFIRAGYAIEYDAIEPTQLKATLESKKIERLFFAGQINGTSGYEEAAGQGLIAGANAAARALGGNTISIDRYTAFIGVMIDDLITRGADEPYRMFTSRAENRLQLRSDNADRRLTPLAREFGLVNEERWRRYTHKAEEMQRATAMLEEFIFRSEDEARGSGVKLRGALSRPTSAADLLVRPETKIGDFERAIPSLREIGEEARATLEADLKYGGYIKKQNELAERMRESERNRIPEDIDYASIPGLKREAMEKLIEIRPETLAQASRVAGVTPAGIAALAIEMARNKRSRGNSAT